MEAIRGELKKFWGSTATSAKMSSSSDDETHCPLCLEVLDETDKSVLLCQCEYQVCLYCFNHIKMELNDRCPVCRTPYP